MTPPFEHRRQRVATRRRFVERLAKALAFWALLTTGGLLVGMAGYAYFEGMSTADAFVNAAMILSGMGPVSELKTLGGKIFAGCYAILSGLILVIGASFVLAPVFHRVLHKFHVESDRDDS